jgi:hypothetical protein
MSPDEVTSPDVAHHRAPLGSARSFARPRRMQARRSRCPHRAPREAPGQLDRPQDGLQPQARRDGRRAHASRSGRSLIARGGRTSVSARACSGRSSPVLARVSAQGRQRRLRRWRPFETKDGVFRHRLVDRVQKDIKVGDVADNHGFGFAQAQRLVHWPQHRRLPRTKDRAAWRGRASSPSVAGPPRLTRVLGRATDQLRRLNKIGRAGSYSLEGAALRGKSGAEI